MGRWSSQFILKFRQKETDVCRIAKGKQSSANALGALALMISFFSGYHASSQKNSITFYEHIEPIIHKNCTPCHQPDQAGPFNLITFDDVYRKGDFIGKVTSSRYMPPWKADREFQKYRNERLLTDNEISMIGTWISNGMPKGKREKRSKAPTFEPASKPDLSLAMKDPYMIPTSSVNDFRFFNIPTNLPEDTYIRKIEFIPGNKRLVHHSRLMTDTTNRVRSIDGMSANDPEVSQFEKYPPVDKFLYGWVPGNFAIEFPKGTGKKIYKDSDIIANIHYSPNAREGQTDQSKVNFYFAKDSVLREVYSLAIAEDNISNRPFVIPPNEVKTFYGSFGPIPIDISGVAILPHMHFLGKTFKAFAVTPEGEAIFLVKIDKWDFNWQDTYQFQKLLKIPKGSTILVEATFDNTAQNPANPSSPPKNVTYGWETTSEMLNMVLYYLDYREGDENLDPYD